MFKVLTVKQGNTGLARRATVSIAIIIVIISSVHFSWGRNYIIGKGEFCD